MKTDLTEIQNTLKNLMRVHVPPLQIRKDNENVFELAGTIEAMQGKQKVDGYYFASVVPKPKDIRLYFFPIYTHVAQFDSMSDALKKFLKGKSCFHIKKLSPELKEEIAQMINLGVELYKTDGLI
ncbi:hypothetical protein [Chondrinema litorale]|uniref:hypothetical protein n=1 Tax=Chondrinema litorale TaxID=2994555 RepID=UPI002543B599|nr:hypothetical protein [Chondrinema litorale]UZR92457.1 hypothetical protein OQ292_11355 [Chondrinema litorale]